MKSPVTGKEMQQLVRIEELHFRGVNYQIQYHYLLCEDSKTEYTTTELDELNLNQVLLLSNPLQK